jgi:starch synthase
MLQDRALEAGMETNGFSFDGTDTAGLDYALNRALTAWYSDQPGWNELTARIMRTDWSWQSPGLDYIELYYKSIKS